MESVPTPTTLINFSDAEIEHTKTWLDAENKNSVTGMEILDRLTGDPLFPTMFRVHPPTSAHYRAVSGLMSELGWSSKRVAAGTLYLRPRDKSMPGMVTAQEDVVGTLKLLLKEAQEGRLHAIIGLYRTHDGKAHVFWPGTNEIFSGATTPAELWEMVGRLEILKHEILDRHLRHE